MPALLSHYLNVDAIVYKLMEQGLCALFVLAWPGVPEPEPEPEPEPVPESSVALK
jgi:hypothetical protein